MALITLTRDQFLKRKPKGDYSSYLKYIGNARAGRPVGQGVGPQVQLPMNPNAVNQFILKNLTSGYLNPKQQRQQAVQSVNDSIKAALAELREPAAAAQLQANRQANAYEGFAQTLAEARRSDADYVRDLYRGAADDQALFASGITGAVGNAARSDAAAQQADVQAATGQGPGYVGTDIPSMQGVGYYLGGQLPSGRLAENAAYASQDMLRQGLASASRLALEGAGMRQKSIDLQSDLAKARAKLISGKPAAIREAMKGLSDDQRANLATLANVAYLQNTQAKTTADLTGQYQGQPTIDTYTDSKGVVRHYNPNTHIVKTSKNGTQFLAPLPVPKSTSSTTKNAAGFTPSQQATQTRMRNEAIQGGRKAMLTAAQNKSGPLYNAPPSFLQGIRPPTPKSYAEAKAYLMTQYANDLIKQYPGERARILQTVEEVLAAGGFKRAAATKAPAAAGGGLFGALNPLFPVPKSASR